VFVELLECITAEVIQVRLVEFVTIIHAELAILVQIVQSLFCAGVVFDDGLGHGCLLLEFD
jgi:hypothetical protein